MTFVSMQSGQAIQSVPCKSVRSTSQRKLPGSCRDMHSMQVNFDRMTQIAGNHASELGIFPAERNQWNLLNQSLPPHQGQPSRQRKDTLPPTKLSLC